MEETEKAADTRQRISNLWRVRKERAICKASDCAALRGSYMDNHTEGGEAEQNDVVCAERKLWWVFLFIVVKFSIRREKGMHFRPFSLKNNSKATRFRDRVAFESGGLVRTTFVVVSRQNVRLTQ